MGSNILDRFDKVQSSVVRCKDCNTLVINNVYAKMSHWKRSKKCQAAREKAARKRNA